jgi:hypothetical protein
MKRLLALLLLLWASPALAHEDWPWECCHNMDCAEVEFRHVRVVGGMVLIRIPPGGHPMWPADGRGMFEASIPLSEMRDAIRPQWGVCISPAGKLLCVFAPQSGT